MGFVPKCIYFTNSAVKVAMTPFVRGIYGTGRLPRHRPMILAANHSSLMDGVILTVYASWALKQPVHTIAYEEPFGHWFMGYLLRSGRCIPFARGDLQSRLAMMRLALGYLHMREPVAIFPEAHLNDGKRLRRARPGAGLLALESGAPLVPIGIRRTREVLPLGARRPVLKRVAEIEIGEPLSVTGESVAYRRADEDARAELVEMVMTRLMQAIARLSGMEPPKARRRRRRSEDDA